MKCLYLVTRSLDPTGVGRARWTMRWLSRPGARCRHCCRSVSIKYSWSSLGSLLAL